MGSLTKLQLNNHRTRIFNLTLGKGSGFSSIKPPPVTVMHFQGLSDPEKIDQLVAPHPDGAHKERGAGWAGTSAHSRSWPRRGGGLAEKGAPPLILLGKLETTLLLLTAIFLDFGEEQKS